MQKQSRIGLIGPLLLLMSLVLAACTAPNGQAEPAAEEGLIQAQESTAASENMSDAEEQIIAAATDSARDVARNPLPNTPKESEVIVTKEPKTLANYLPNLGKAPEVTNEVWINSEKPLRLADLRGKVVLVEFWTFG